MLVLLKCCQFYSMYEAGKLHDNHIFIGEKFAQELVVYDYE